MSASRKWVVLTRQGKERQRDKSFDCQITSSCIYTILRLHLKNLCRSCFRSYLSYVPWKPACQQAPNWRKGNKSADLGKSLAHFSCTLHSITHIGSKHWSELIKSTHATLTHVIRIRFSLQQHAINDSEMLLCCMLRHVLSQTERTEMPFKCCITIASAGTTFESEWTKNVIKESKSTSRPQVAY